MNKLKAVFIAVTIVAAAGIMATLYVSNKNLENKILKLSNENRELNSKIDTLSSQISVIDASISSKLESFNNLNPEINRLHDQLQQNKTLISNSDGKLKDLLNEYIKEKEDAKVTNVNQDELCKKREEIGYPCK